MDHQNGLQNEYQQVHQHWTADKAKSRKSPNQNANDPYLFPSRGPLRTKGAHPSRTASDNSSLRGKFTNTTLDEKRAPKRLNDDGEGPPYPAKLQRTPSRPRQDSFSQQPQGYDLTSPTAAALQINAANARHVTSPRGNASQPVVSPAPSQASESGLLPEVLLLKQPPTRPISEQQLINEVKGIYAGLVMVEKKCVEIVTQQSQSTKRLENQQWKALVALHRTLLQEHHDFFSASQHPTASDALKRLAIKYAMPARMWRHGIHAFLELLRHRLPDSMEHMLSFIYLSYSMMALLKESVPSFVETWIECLGDLARYRMAIEDSDPRDREIWSNVARMWYNEAADKSPNVGRIQHHLAVLARPNIVEQLFFYGKALTSVVPFTNARESIMLLFDMFVKNNEQMQARYLVTESSLVHAFAILFTRGSVAQFYVLNGQFTANFSGHIDRSGPKLKIQGPQIAMSLFAGMIDFAKDDSRPYIMYQDATEKLAAEKLKRTEAGKSAVAAETGARNDMQKEEFSNLTLDSTVERVAEAPAAQPDAAIQSSSEVAALAGILFRNAVSIIASRIGDKNIVPFMHSVLSSLWGWSFIPGGLVYIEANVPWDKIATFLNTIGRSGISYNNVEMEEFPPSFGGFGRQLPEDFLLRGFVMTQHYYPVDFWTGTLVDEDERTVELPSHQAPRVERCLWLGIRLSTLGRYLTYDWISKEFSCTKFAETLKPP